MALVGVSELRMLQGDDLGGDAYHVQRITDWLSIRLLDALCRLGESPTGDVERRRSGVSTVIYTPG